MVHAAVEIEATFLKATTLYLSSWWKCESGVISHDEGEDGLEEEGHEGVEPEDQTVTVIANMARNLETGTNHVQFLQA